MLSECFDPILLKRVVVERAPHNLATLGSNPAWCWSFSDLPILSSESLTQVPHSEETIPDFPQKYAKLCHLTQNTEFVKQMLASSFSSRDPKTPKLVDIKHQAASSSAVQAS